jgi:hypothetical protein
VRRAPGNCGARKGSRRSPPRWAHFANTQPGFARRPRRIGRFQQHHDENAKTEADQQRKADDEDVLHTRSLRSCTVLWVRPRRLQRRRRFRDVNTIFRRARRSRFSTRARCAASGPVLQSRTQRGIRQITGRDAGGEGHTRPAGEKSGGATLRAAVVASPPVGGGIPGTMEEE